MKLITALLLALFIQSDALCTDAVEQAQQLYDPTLAAKFGADEYGMKMYVMAFLKKGPKRDQSPEIASQLQRAHLSNIKRMAKSGELVLAGPFAENEMEIQGIYIFNVQTIEEARALTATDPAIKAGRLTMELIPWYGTAALMQVNELGLKLAKKSF